MWGVYGFIYLRPFLYYWHLLAWRQYAASFCLVTAHYIMGAENVAHDCRKCGTFCPLGAQKISEGTETPLHIQSWDQLGPVHTHSHKTRVQGIPNKETSMIHPKILVLSATEQHLKETYTSGIHLLPYSHYVIASYPTDTHTTGAWGLPWKSLESHMGLWLKWVGQ